MESPTEKPQNERVSPRDDRRGVDKQQNIQDAFLNSARRDKTLLTVHLTGGVKLTGRIRSFDKYSVVVESNNHEQLVFKHAIAMISAARPGASMTAATGLSAPGDATRPSSAARLAGPVDQKQHPGG